ncbi:alpha-methylacyl-CoA racemase [Candidatus Magnetomorum sp. HK-1]|nr:alpha-methylacyl-CoA racemase [Candidatus Magnetomorum sp. HK-1]
MKNGSLKGITVIDISRLLPGPFCSMILADHGARVIGIEDRRYKAEGLYLPTVNRNKSHMTLNLKTDKGKKIFFQLIEQADVLLEGFRPGVTSRLGIDYESLKAINSKLIYCSVTGFGQTGEYKNRAGHDINYLSLSGVLDMIGQKDQPPTIPAIQFADIAGGGMNAVIGIMLALFARERTGKGQYIDISMTDSMVSFLPVSQHIYSLLGEIPQRGDSFLSHRYAFYNTFETSDNRFIAIGALENRFWTILCNYLEKPELIPFQFDEDRRVEIIKTLADIFRTKTLAQWDSELSELDVCYAPIQNFEEVFDHPFFKEREMVVQIKDKANQTLQAIGVPVKLSETPGNIRTPPVSFGENTHDILYELGYTDDDIKAFRKQDVI